VGLIPAIAYMSIPSIGHWKLKNCCDAGKASNATAVKVSTIAGGQDT